MADETQPMRAKKARRPSTTFAERRELVLRGLVALGGVDLGAHSVTEHVDRHRGTVDDILNGLVKDGMVSARRAARGSGQVYSITDAGRAALAQPARGGPEGDRGGEL